MHTHSSKPAVDIELYHTCQLPPATCDSECVILDSLDSDSLNKTLNLLSRKQTPPANPDGVKMNPQIPN